MYEMFINYGSSVEIIKESQNDLKSFLAQAPYVFISLYLVFYLITSLAPFPGLAILSLSAGAIFEFFSGLLFVVVASTIGAYLAFSIARYFLREFIQRKFKRRLKRINSGLQKQGAFYLFTLRLVPIFPFFLVNLLMGISEISSKTFLWVSLVSAIPANVVYVYVGTSLRHVTSAKDIFSLSFIFSIILLTFFPLLARNLIRWGSYVRHKLKYKAPSQFDYDVIVLGNSDVAYNTAINTSDLGAKALLCSVDKDQRDLKADATELSAPAVDTLNLIYDLVATNKKITVSDYDFSKEQIRVNDPFRITIRNQDNYEVLVTTRSLVVAIDSKPLIPSWIPSDKKFYTVRTLDLINKDPNYIFFIVGGGYSGIIAANFLINKGYKVTLISRSKNLLPREDKEVSLIFKEVLRNRGVNLLLGYAACGYKDGNLIAKNNLGELVTLGLGDLVLAIGHSIDSKEYQGLDDLALATNEGYYLVDDYLKSSLPNVFVCGDALEGEFSLSSLDSQARLCAWNAVMSPFFFKKYSSRLIPFTFPSNPPLSRIGLTESRALEEGFNFESFVLPLGKIGSQGMVKLIYSPKNLKFLGVTVVGEASADLIAIFSVGMNAGMTLKDYLNISFPDSSSSQTVRAIVRKFFDQKNLVRGRFKRQFFEWRRQL
jgi:pyruvate/2-oxoglutarate dehydrogenase complex dihydrolipoamide dehydrogenase (E3) component/uncharacterized membrane protein YdjX (TVP38/TMEM64 family)